MNRAAVVVVLLATSVSTAVAEPGSGRADALFEHGRDLMAAGKTAEACDAFEQSEQLDAVVTTLLNLAACREANGQLATALALFRDAEHQTEEASDAPTRQLHDIAKSKAHALAPRVSKLTIRVTAADQPEGLEVKRDGEVIDPATWNRAVSVDGGTYTIAARAPGRTRWSTKVTVVAEADRQTVDVPRLRAVGAPDAPAPVPAERSLVVPVSVAGAAVGLGIVGGVLDLVAESTYHQALAATTLPRYESLYSSANTDRYAAQGFAIAAVACAAVAVGLYFHGRGTVAVATPGGVAIAGRF